MNINDFFKTCEAISSPFHYIFKRKISHYLYQKSIVRILTSVNDKRLRESYRPLDLIDSREFRGVINSLFQPGDYHFSTMDIAVAINIATGHYCGNEFNKLSHEIIDFSYHLSLEIKESIIKSKLMRDGLADYGKNIALVEVNSEREKLNVYSKTKIIYLNITFPHSTMLILTIALESGIKVMIIHGLTGTKKTLYA
ncbi:hypothetical protein ACJVQT_19205 [Enterobacter huaxiensis]|uniref:hypothetical protein n=1 Tax=Enterobacter huaxiensis TaxID=2494702 RepID=UPI0021757BA5|nr:hypothetical protein [Enterobacter huaxiensis]MCS5451514.1 hypothetical protein [Enterobacter huaxiensis]